MPLHLKFPAHGYQTGLHINVIYSYGYWDMGQSTIHFNHENTKEYINSCSSGSYRCLIIKQSNQETLCFDDSKILIIVYSSCLLPLFYVQRVKRDLKKLNTITINQSISIHIGLFFKYFLLD